MTGRALAAVLVVLLGVGGAAVFAAGGSDDGDRAADPAPRAAAVNRFNSTRAFALLRAQVRMGPRPAGSAASRRLAARLRRLLPAGRYERVPGGLRNVVGRLAGRGDRAVLVAAHYDTKDLPGFVGANDGASGTAAVVEIARTLRRVPASRRPELRFALFDGEEAPRGVPDDRFLEEGLRGSRAYLHRHPRGTRAMVLLDFVGDRRLSIPRETGSDAALWARLRAAARRVGALSVFPPRTQAEVYDDHTPFARAGIPAIDLIDFDFPCWHRRCDDLSAVSERSVDRVGETVVELVLDLGRRVER